MHNVGGSLSLVVPLFNEEVRVAESLAPLFEYVERCKPGSRLIFVDDGSSDRTADVVEMFIAESGSDSISLVRRPHLGKGAAVRYGLGMADTDLAAFCDVDLATPLDELSRVVEIACKVDGLAIGSRAVADTELKVRESLRREVAGRAFNWLVQSLVCPGVQDTQCGAKAAPVWVWKVLLAESVEDGFAWDVEVVSKALKVGIRVEEVGVRWLHDDRSRVNVGRDGLNMVGAVLRLKFKSLVNQSIIRDRPEAVDNKARVL